MVFGFVQVIRDRKINPDQDVCRTSIKMLLGNWSNASTQELARGCPRGVMVKVMDCGIVVREFVLQSHYYVHFRANALGKGMNPLILPAMG